MPSIKQYNNETDLKDHVRDAIKKKYGRNAWFYKTHDMCRVGIPDIFLVFYGWGVGIELKMPGEKLKPIQSYNLKLIREAGGHGFGACSVDEVIKKLDLILVEASNEGPDDFDYPE